MIDEKPQELLHLNIKELSSTITRNIDKSFSIEMNIERIQIDNQIAQTQNPTLFEPALPSSSSSSSNPHLDRKQIFFSFFANLTPLVAFLFIFFIIFNFIIYLIIFIYFIVIVIFILFLFYLVYLFMILFYYLIVYLLNFI